MDVPAGTGEQDPKFHQRQVMKIAIISKADQFGGGASRVASELATLLNAAGHLTDHWLSWAGSPWTPRMKSLYGSFQFPVRAANLCMRRIGFPELLPFELAILLHRGRAWEYDLLHFHDISSAISPQTLLWLSRRKPVVWTIHDCSPFTGGCLYPGSCTRFTNRCGGCPQLGGWPIDSWLDFTGFQQDNKRRLAASGRIHYSWPSAWMASTGYSSGMFHTPPEIIPYGIDLEIFHPQDKKAARIQLGLPSERTIVLLSAGSLMDVRKGVRFALEAIQANRALNPFVLLVGSPNPEIREQLSGLDVHEAGYIGDAHMLASHYAAADVFLFTSLADNLPLTVLETMATGTPIVGYETGGIPEMVVQNETGLLVPQDDDKGLAEALARAILNPDLRQRWAANGIERARHHYSYDHFLGNHLTLYERLIAARQSPVAQAG